MLRSIHLSRFKRFRDDILKLGSLTLLTGFNSGGKSSTMQALLLLRQAASMGDLNGPSLRDVPLNGPGFTLGELRTVVNEVSGGSTFAITVESEVSRMAWSFGEGSLPRDRLAIPCSISASGDPESILGALRSMRFVPADRVGPAETYPLDDPSSHEMPGRQGELTFGNLWWLSGIQLRNPKLRHPDPSIPSTFDHQVGAWLGALFPGVVLEPRVVPHANLLTLGIRTNTAYEFHRPRNVGFGITYVLPVIISLLMATPGDVVMIENPEAHLHPRAQAHIARMCARAAASGVQVIVESHSDHVLNGIRVAVHGGTLPPDDVSILFFASPFDDSLAAVKQIGVNRRGGLEEWPDGFFDEGDRLLDRLLDPVRGGSM